MSTDVSRKALQSGGKKSGRGVWGVMVSESPMTNTKTMFGGVWLEQGLEGPMSFNACRDEKQWRGLTWERPREQTPAAHAE